MKQTSSCFDGSWPYEVIAWFNRSFIIELNLKLDLTTQVPVVVYTCRTRKQGRIYAWSTCPAAQWPHQKEPPPMKEKQVTDVGTESETWVVRCLTCDCEPPPMHRTWASTWVNLAPCEEPAVLMKTRNALKLSRQEVENLRWKLKIHNILINLYSYTKFYFDDCVLVHSVSE